ncbi:hypothetical protein SAMN05216316_1513 [Nitrosovibrio sp. Nv6]|nr:hypothetical protein SAMN05216316_1513 [Nitrosovibrio sp. Nv6]
MDFFVQGPDPNPVRINECAVHTIGTGFHLYDMGPIAC